MDNKLHIKKRQAAGKNERYGVTSLSIKLKTVEQLDKIANEANLSRNELINIMLEYGLKNCKIIDG